VFEGSEKKVEIIVDGSLGSLRAPGMPWQQVVARASAAILSQVSNDLCDAYLLSESSLFVYDRAVVMITCGTTSLASAIEEMMTFLPCAAIRMLMYERKNEIFPDQQPTSFDQDVAWLHRCLGGGDSLILGDPSGNHVRLFHYSNQFTARPDDMTLEILMHDLDPSVRRNFAYNKDTRQIRDATGIDQIFPEFVLDDYAFQPLGYSCNGIFGREYYTSHVTPEDECSFASFETNHMFHEDLSLTVERVLDVFRPQSTSVMVFHNHGLSIEKPTGYLLARERRASRAGYNICLKNFEREGGHHAAT